MKRTIIVGDVHGCSVELKELLEKVSYQKDEDELYFVGDLINRGPNSKGVYELLKESEAISVLGNHEYALLQSENGERPMKDWILQLRTQFGKLYPEFLADLKTWPVYLEKKDFILVHAGLVPDVPLHEADPHALTNIRNFEQTPWFDFYHDKKLVVFGHWAQLEGIVRDNIIGLDTGCVYGKKLTAVILPERKLITVNAKEVYKKIQ